MSSTTAAPPQWQEAVFNVLKKGGVRQVAYVPDAGHSLRDRRGATRPGDHTTSCLTTEEEGVASSAAPGSAEQRAVLLMQSSGVGNCVNMFSLLQSCRFPFLTLVTMRGEYAEFNPWQIPMGLATQQALEADGDHRSARGRSRAGRGGRQRRVRRRFRSG